MIPIKNIYYMLTYAFQILKQDKYKSCETEEFENTEELFSEILIITISKEIKKGLGKGYILKEALLKNPKGKFKLTESVKNLEIKNQKIFCEYDEFSLNIYLNQIIKTTCQLLIKSNITSKRKKSLKKLMMYFIEVEELNPKMINWNIKFNKNNKTYEMLIYICWLVINSFLQANNQKNLKNKNFIDEQKMKKLYEKFVLEFYKKEYPKLKINSSQIKWLLDDDNDEDLPKMQSDITIESNDKILIIDTKYYEHLKQEHYNKKTIHSYNLYQIFTYVKNKNTYGKEVSGMLLYAKTDEEDNYLDRMYLMSGNKIYVKCLDLNVEFKNIKEQLFNILKECEIT